jgi:hypothetical protein
MDLSSRPRPRLSLFVTLALAAVGASCKSGTGAPRDASGAAGTGGAGGMDADTDGPGGRVVAGSGGADASPLDLGGFDTTQDVARDAATPDGAVANPGRLWLSGPESDIHLADTEPLTPF